MLSQIATDLSLIRQQNIVEPVRAIAQPWEAYFA